MDSQVVRKRPIGTPSEAMSKLMKRVRNQQDFPMLSESIMDINRILADDECNAVELSNAVSRDISLTNKLLKVINSSFYAHLAKGVSSVKHAVLLLGFKKIRSIVIALMVLDHMSNDEQAQQIKDRIVSALYSALMAEHISDDCNYMDNNEEIFLASMFHQLGCLITSYYFYNESKAIEELVQDENLSHDEASQKVMGVKLSDFSVAIAKEWNLPDSILHSMNDVKLEVYPKKPNQLQKLQMMATFSNDITEAINLANDGNWQDGIEEIADRYQDHFDYDAKKITKIIDEVNREMIELNAVLSFDVRQTHILENLTKDPEEAAVSTQDLADADDSFLDDGSVMSSSAANAPGPDVTIDNDGFAISSNMSSDDDFMSMFGDPFEDESADSLLSEGIDEIKQMVASGNFVLNDVFRKILDVMYGSLELDTALLCIINRSSKMMEAKLGRGESIHDFIHEFKFSTNYQPDVFHIVLDKGVDIFIQDTEDAKIKSRIPGWYRQLSDAQNFILMPLMMKKKPLGLIYIDNSAKGGLKVTDQEFELLKSLRNQAVDAIKQKMSG